MPEVFLSLGSNIGNREEKLSEALNYIAGIGKIKAISAIYETSSWGFESDMPFYNQVILIETMKTPIDLLKDLKIIEKQLGRKTTKSLSGYESRQIDIDILFYDSIILNVPDLIIPHPHIQNRMFVLVPLNEIAPDKIHPVLKKTIACLLSECNDKGSVNKVN